MKAPETLTTPRLLLRRPRRADAPAIFARYAADPDVTRYLGWPRHRSVADTEGFLRFSDAEWQRWPAGPYLIFARDAPDASAATGIPAGQLLGGTGLAFEAPDRASTGYVLARDAWGRGLATEALRAMLDLAPSLGLARLYALCHPDHRASYRVMEKCGFTREATLPRHAAFPNLDPSTPSDVLCYATIFRS